MFDYARARATASRLIANFGAPVSFKKAAAAGADPWAPTVTTTTSTVTAVDLGIRIRPEPGTQVTRRVRVLYIQAGGVVPEITDRVQIGGVWHEIVEAMPLSPAGVDVMYEVALNA